MDNKLDLDSYNKLAKVRVMNGSSFGCTVTKL
jgi:hypothetical protein